MEYLVNKQQSVVRLRDHGIPRRTHSPCLGSVGRHMLRQLSFLSRRTCSVSIPTKPSTGLEVSTRSNGSLSHKFRSPLVRVISSVAQSRSTAQTFFQASRKWCSKLLGFESLIRPKNRSSEEFSTSWANSVSETPAFALWLNGCPFEPPRKKNSIQTAGVHRVVVPSDGFCGSLVDTR